jgi:hypothetical protein
MKLEEYFGSQIPEYTILSHCVRSLYILCPCLNRVFFGEKKADSTILKWGAEEVTFQHINDLEWRGMRGATKIKYASSFCRKELHRYIWIDTCCIDKSSSAELSEAINSMYGWYEDAIVCYAYLEDVEHALSAHAPDGPANKDKKIRESRWFSRGWTLQELIAPKRVRFFDRQWEYLGSREDLSPLLSSITTIPEDVLAEPKNRRDCSVARKMTWAAKRQTTRIEDVAYSLLGIFDVNMPLLYGEGRKAFIRLQEEILKETDDQSLLAWGLVGKDRYTTATGVFASDPEAFLGSEDVVPFPSKPERQAPSMTNRGVRIQLPVWTNPDLPILDRYPFAILDCQYKNDFSGAIGIPLIPTRDDSIFLRKPADKGTIWPTLNFKGHEVRTIHISKRALTTKKNTARETCLIRASSLEDKGYDIFPIVPYKSSPGLWNEKTKVLYMEYRYETIYDSGLAQKRASTAIAFCNPLMGSCFIVMIILRREIEDFQTKTRPLVKIFEGPSRADRLGLEEWSRSGSYPRSHSKVDWNGDDTFILHEVFSPLPTMTISARIKEEEVLNQNVLVLSVSLLSGLAS